MNDHESGNPLEKRPAASWGSALTFLVSLALALGLPSPALAGPNDEDLQAAWRLLDYVAVDYRGAVADGRVISTQEFAEITELSNAVEAKISGLPSSPNRASLIAEAKAFRAIVARKAAPDDVSTAARALGNNLLAALAPSKAPDLARGAALYAQNAPVATA